MFIIEAQLTKCLDSQMLDDDNVYVGALKCSLSRQLSREDVKLTDKHK